MKTSSAILLPMPSSPACPHRGQYPRDMMQPFHFMITGDFLVAFLKTLTDSSQP